jgi:hypothetical protein
MFLGSLHTIPSVDLGGEGYDENSWYFRAQGTVCFITQAKIFNLLSNSCVPSAYPVQNNVMDPG